MKHTLYQRMTPSGTVASQVAGLEFVQEGTGAPTGVRADQLFGLVPETGDRLSDTKGKVWAVQTVGELADGIYPLTCKPLGGET